MTQKIWEDLQQPVAKAMQAVEQKLATVTAPSSSLGAALGRLMSGGKRLRPLLVLLSSSFQEEGLPAKQADRVCCLAASFEILHMASLVHDDVVDDAATRRGRRSVQAACGVDTALHLGDFLFGRAIALLRTIDCLVIEQMISQTLRRMCEGELAQWAARFSFPLSRRAYLVQIYRKTALLLASSCCAGGQLAQLPKPYVHALARYGRWLGMAFQLADDALDWQGNTAELGKPVLQDLQQGYVTMPVLCSLQSSDREVREMIEEYLHEEGSRPLTSQLLSVVHQRKGVEQTLALARQYAQKACQALDPLPRVPAYQSLWMLAQQIVVRTS